MEKNPVHSPFFSIVTVAYNPGDLLKATMESVLEQEFKNFEWVVVDGGSSDGTQEFLRQQSDRIDQLLVEPDRGIYDAMNKGLSLANGAFVLFLNCGDRLLHPKVLSEVAAAATPATRIISSDFTTVSNARATEGNYIATAPCTLAHLRRDFNACHQAIYIHRSLWGRFDLDYRLLADYKWVVEAATGLPEEAIVHLSTSTVAYLKGGASAKSTLLNFKERFRLHRELFGFGQVLKNIPNYARRVLREVKQFILSPS